MAFKRDFMCIFFEKGANQHILKELVSHSIEIEKLKSIEF